jgi:DNA-binding HxlR family transcriptional regulator
LVERRGTLDMDELETAIPEDGVLVVLDACVDQGFLHPEGYPTPRYRLTERGRKFIAASQHGANAA